MNIQINLTIFLEHNPYNFHEKKFAHQIKSNCLFLANLALRSLPPSRRFSQAAVCGRKCPLSKDKGCRPMPQSRALVSLRHCTSWPPSNPQQYIYNSPPHQHIYHIMSITFIKCIEDKFQEKHNCTLKVYSHDSHNPIQIKFICSP